jgi:hypothetical protein
MRDATRFKKVYPYGRQEPRYVGTNTILSGIDAPPPSTLGNEGDFYLDTDGAALYGPKGPSSWPSGPLSLIGPTGPTGATGLTGETGPQGEPGPQGEDGLQGIQGLTGPLPDGKIGNTIWVTRETGGAYGSLQDAIDAASQGDTILVGAGNWGEISLKGGISICGLQAPCADEVVLSKITFDAPTGVSAATNTVFLANLRVSTGSNARTLELKGGKMRVHMKGVRFYRNNATVGGLPLTSIHATPPVGDTESSVIFEDCMFTPESGQYEATLMESSCRYIDLDRCKFWGGKKTLALFGGVATVNNCRFETSSVGSETISISGAGTTLSIANSLIKNEASNSTGIQIGLGSACSIANSLIDIPAGSGAAISGASAVASFLYKSNVLVPPPIPGAKNTSINNVSNNNLAALL